MAMTPDDDTPEGPDAAAVAAIAGGVLGLLLSIGALALYGTKAGLSVGVGAIIAVANLVTMSAIIRALLKPPDEPEGEKDESTQPAEPQPRVDHRAEGKRGGTAWGIFAVLKILILFGGIWILLTRGWVDPIPLVVGYGVLPIGIAASGLLTSLAPRRKTRRTK
jgi:hypothetical protein